MRRKTCGGKYYLAIILKSDFFYSFISYNLQILPNIFCLPHVVCLFLIVITACPKPISRYVPK